MRGLALLRLRPRNVVYVHGDDADAVVRHRGRRRSQSHSFGGVQRPDGAPRLQPPGGDLGMTVDHRSVAARRRHRPTAVAVHIFGPGVHGVYGATGGRPMARGGFRRTPRGDAARRAARLAASALMHHRAPPRAWRHSRPPSAAGRCATPLTTVVADGDFTRARNVPRLSSDPPVGAVLEASRHMPRGAACSTRGVFSRDGDRRGRRQHGARPRCAEPRATRRSPKPRPSARRRHPGAAVQRRAVRFEVLEDLRAPLAPDAVDDAVSRRAAPRSPGAARPSPAPRCARGRRARPFDCGRRRVSIESAVRGRLHAVEAAGRPSVC